MNVLFWLIPVLAVCALCFAAYKANYVAKAPAGTPRMQEIAAAIAEGADAFLMSEYKILAVFIAVLFLLIGFFIGWGTAVCFLLGPAALRVKLDDFIYERELLILEFLLDVFLYGVGIFP